MNYAEVLVAKKYASAVQEIFHDAFSLPVVQRCAELAAYLRIHRDILLLLQLSAIDEEKKRDGLISLTQQYALPQCMIPLVDLLIAHKRAFLFAAVLQALYDLYLEQHNILSFTITSSHPLSQSAVSNIERFLAHKTGSTIIYTCVVDPTLIAGIRLLNTTRFWEYSVARQLRSAHNMLV